LSVPCGHIVGRRTGILDRGSLGFPPRTVHPPITHLSLPDLSAGKPAWATSTELSQALGESEGGGSTTCYPPVRLPRWFAPILPTTESPTKKPEPNPQRFFNIRRRFLLIWGSMSRISWGRASLLASRFWHVLQYGGGDPRSIDLCTSTRVHCLRGI